MPDGTEHNSNDIASYDPAANVDTSSQTANSQASNTTSESTESPTHTIMGSADVVDLGHATYEMADALGTMKDAELAFKGAASVGDAAGAGSAAGEGLSALEAAGAILTEAATGMIVVNAIDILFLETKSDGQNFQPDFSHQDNYSPEHPNHSSQLDQSTNNDQAVLGGGHSESTGHQASGSNGDQGSHEQSNQSSNQS